MRFTSMIIVRREQDQSPLTLGPKVYTPSHRSTIYRRPRKASEGIFEADKDQMGVHSLKRNGPHQR